VERSGQQLGRQGSHGTRGRRSEVRCRPDVASCGSAVPESPRWTTGGPRRR
jgi:hypothetical protein